MGQNNDTHRGIVGCGSMDGSATAPRVRCTSAMSEPRRQSTHGEPFDCSIEGFRSDQRREKYFADTAIQRASARAAGDGLTRKTG